MRDKVKKERVPSAHSSGSSLNDAVKKAKKKAKDKVPAPEPEVERVEKKPKNKAPPEPEVERVEKKPKNKADQIKLSINKYGTTRYDTITAKSGHQVISALQQYLMVGAVRRCDA